MDVAGLSSLWPTPLTGQVVPGCIRKSAERESERSQQAASLYGFSFKFSLEFL